jgi:rhamnulokinase
MKLKSQAYLAVDLGAESGRVMAGLWNGHAITLEEIHRFPNRSLESAGKLRWDITRLWREIEKGLTRAAISHGKKIISVGADTWGVDYALLNKKDELLAAPRHYRDARTRGLMEKAFAIMPRAEIFSRTGLQFMQFNTLYQLLATQRQEPKLIERADCLLLMPDFFHWRMCGSKVVEATNASTTQCLNATTRKWDKTLLKQFGLPAKIFPQIVKPGARLGKLRGSVRERTGLGAVRVIAPPTHDTASAVTAVPTASTGKTNWAYISSGTWSLMGIETRKASLSPRTLELNLTNEGGIDGTFRLLKNIMGLWIVQQCRRSFERRGAKYDYAQLAQLAARAKPLRSIVNPNDLRFLNPPDMAEAMQNYCRETRQPVPLDEGALVRCAYESLALIYRDTLGCLEELAGNSIEVIHIIGGGSQNRILNQFTADACQRPVLAGPVEATALGNVLVQARANGEIGSLREIREVIRKSSVIEEFLPGPAGEWNKAAERFAVLRAFQHE